MNHTHYSVFGVSSAPMVADAAGFISWRDGFESLPEADWTEGERWIYREEERLFRSIFEERRV